jgi:hypothetical protein
VEARLCLLAALATLTQRLEHDLDPEQDQTDRRTDDDDGDRRVVRHLLERVLRHRRANEPDRQHDADHCNREPPVHAAQASGRRATLRGVLPGDVNYASGDDYVLEFLEYRFSFGAEDFEERVTAAAVRLGLVESNDLDPDEVADLVELAADGRLGEARSGLGQYLVRHWERLALVEGESLVYWLRRLIFRGAYLDHRVKEGLLEVAWDDDSSDFGYADSKGGRPLLELAPVPSWHALQFRR